MINISEKDNRCIVAGTNSEICNDISNVVYAILKTASDIGQEQADDLASALGLAFALGMLRAEKASGMDIKLELPDFEAIMKEDETDG